MYIYSCIYIYIHEYICIYIYKDIYITYRYMYVSFIDILFIYRHILYMSKMCMLYIQIHTAMYAYLYLFDIIPIITSNGL